MNVNGVTERVIGAAIAVHRELGPGLLESAYRECMAEELQANGVRFAREVAIAAAYRGRRIDCSYRLDFLVEDAVVLELKAVAKLDPIHTAQLLTYLKTSGLHVGLLINFNVALLKDGIRRVVLNLPP